MIKKITYTNLEGKRNRLKIQKELKLFLRNKYEIKIPDNYFLSPEVMKGCEKTPYIAIHRKTYTNSIFTANLFIHPKTKKEEFLIHFVFINKKEFKRLKKMLEKSKLNIEVTLSK